MNSSDPFDSPKSLIRWAREDIAKFEIVRNAFFNSYPYRTDFEINPQTGKEAHIVRLNKEFPDELRKLTHNTVSCLRHALDQGTFIALSELIVGFNDDKLYFPFVTCPSDLEGTMTSKGFPERIKPVFRKFEPYKRGNSYPGGDDKFRALCDVAGPNKHRAALGISGTVIGTAMYVEHAVGLEMKGAPKWDTEKNEIVIGHFAPEPRAQYKLRLSTYVSFIDLNGAKDVPVEDTLIYWLERVTSFISDIGIAVLGP